MRPSEEFFQKRQAQLITVGLGLLKRSSVLGRGECLVVAAVNRGVGLLRGFCDLTDSENYISAAPLVRLQLDCGLRAFALLMTADPHDAAGRVIAGKPLDEIEDQNGKVLRDRRIVNTVEQRVYPGVDALYTRASGYVHLSENHYYQAFEVRESNERPPDIEIKVGALDRFVSPEQRANLTADFGMATDVLSVVAQIWIEMPRSDSRL